MNFMLNKVVEEGTGKRAMLEGIRAAGKTGTTNGYRDAWFVGYTGNLVAGVWFGNDDHTSTNNMTGGTLPAMTWKEVMAFAHQNLELRPIPGLAPEPGPAVAFASTHNAASAKNGAAAVHSAGGARHAVAALLRGDHEPRRTLPQGRRNRPARPAVARPPRRGAISRGAAPTQRYGFGPTPAARSGKQVRSFFGAAELSSPFRGGVGGGGASAICPVVDGGAITAP